MNSDWKKRAASLCAFSSRLFAVHWKDVAEIKYSPTLRWFTIFDGQTKPIRVGTLITGINVLLDTFENNLPETIFKKAIEKYKT